MATVTLQFYVPPGVSASDIEQFILFKHFGHSINSDILAKFKHDELDCEDFEINMNGTIE